MRLGRRDDLQAARPVLFGDDTDRRAHPRPQLRLTIGETGEYRSRRGRDDMPNFAITDRDGLDHLAIAAPKQHHPSFVYGVLGHAMAAHTDHEIIRQELESARKAR